MVRRDHPPSARAGNGGGVSKVGCPICVGGCDAQMCRSCARSYDRTAHREGTVMEAMRWAANRARRESARRWAPTRKALADLRYGMSGPDGEDEGT